MKNQDDFQFTPQSNHPGDQLITETISSYVLQSIAGLLIKLGDIAKKEMPEGDPDYEMGKFLQALGRIFGQQVMSQCQHVGAVDEDKTISFVVPVTCVSKVCRILTDALKMGKISVSMHGAWTPFAEAAIKIIPGGSAMLRKAKFRMDNPEHPGLEAYLN